MVSRWWWLYVLLDEVRFWAGFNWSYAPLGVKNAHILIMGKCCPDDNAFIFYSILIILVGDQDRHKMHVVRIWAILVNWLWRCVPLSAMFLMHLWWDKETSISSRPVGPILFKITMWHRRAGRKVALGLGVNLAKHVVTMATNSSLLFIMGKMLSGS